MDKYRKAVSVLIGVIVALLVFLAGFYFITSDLQKKENLRLKEKLQTVKDEKVFMANELTLGEQEKQALREQIASARKELSVCSSSKDGSKQNPKNLNKLIKMSDEQIRQLIQEKKFLENAAVELTGKLSEIIAENKELKKKLSMRESAITILKQTLRQMQNQLSAITFDSDAAKAEIEGLQSELARQEESAKKRQVQFTLVKDRLIKDIKTTKRQLARAEEDKLLLVNDNARQRIELKKNAAQRLKAMEMTSRLSTAVANFSPILIAEIHFATGKWRLTSAHKAILGLARKKTQAYGPDFIGLVEGSSDNQPFRHRSRHNNLELSAKRALSVENWLSAEPESGVQIAAIAISNILAPEEPINNSEKRTAAFFMVKKNSPDLDGLLFGLQNCLKEAN